MSAFVAVLLMAALAFLWPARLDPAIWLREWLNRPNTKDQDHESR